MKNLNALNKPETRDINGGKMYRCKICGFMSSNYFEAYANALDCVMKKYKCAYAQAVRILLREIQVLFGF